MTSNGDGFGMTYPSNGWVQQVWHFCLFLVDSCGLLQVKMHWIFKNFVLKFSFQIITYWALFLSLSFAFDKTVSPLKLGFRAELCLGGYSIITISLQDVHIGSLIPASSGHQTNHQVLCEFPFTCQLASKSASALNDKSMITGWLYNTLGQGITDSQPFSQRAHSLTLPCCRNGWISFIG